MSKKQGKAKAAEGKSAAVPTEPAELTVWRQLVEYRDKLVKVAVTDEDRDARLTQRIARRMGLDEAIEAELIKESHDESRQAREDLAWLDAELEKRRETSPPPVTLVETLRANALLHAVEVVRRFVLDESDLNRERAQATLDAVAMSRGRRPPKDVQELVTDAKRERAAGGRSGTVVPRYVVAMVAGLPLDTRTLIPPKNTIH